MSEEITMAERIKRLDAADLVMAQELDKLRGQVKALAERIIDLEATRGLENTARGQHA